MSDLAESLARRIADSGPLTLAQYMAEALGHPRFGYYKRADPFGRAGDFITAPEVSQMFGELVGLWCVETWRRMGRPPLTLVELGPGRGTLMADVWRAARLDPDFGAAARVHLVETSPLLRDRQRQTLETVGLAPAWHDDFSSVPEGPTILVANELFDALPIHQFERRLEGWRERVVGLGPDGRLCLGLGPPGPALAFVDAAARAGAPMGAVVEVSPASLALMDAVARRLAAHGGAALVFDYGGEGPMGDSFQAVRKHRTHDPLRDPGQADLSARVDFAALARSARAVGAAVHGPLAQGELLERLGLRFRAERLLQRATPREAGDIESALGRLLDPKEMGTLFKALAVSGRPLTPPGFEETC